MDINTHKAIDSRFSGRVTKVEEGRAEVVLHTAIYMCADSSGLIHGGFIFSAADYAAMVAVNEPNVVLGASECKFISPVKKGDSVSLIAEVVSQKGKKRIVEVEGYVNSKAVFRGTFTTFVLEKHVLG